MNERGMLLMESISDLRDDWVLDSAALPSGGSVVKPRGDGWLHRFTESPLAAAVISLTVAAAVLAGIVAAGRMGSAGPGGRPDTTSGFETQAHTGEDSTEWDTNESLSYPPIDTYTIQLQTPVVSLSDQGITAYLIATEPGRTLRYRNKKTFDRVEGNTEILVYRYDGDVIYESYPDSSDDHATAGGGLALAPVEAYLDSLGLPPLIPGLYRLYIDEEMNGKSVMVEVELTEARENESVYAPTELTHTCRFTVEGTEFPLSAYSIPFKLVANEAGKRLRTHINYRFYRLDGNTETLLYEKEVDGFFDADPTNAEDVAVLESGVSLSLLRDEMERKGLGELTPGMYRIRYNDEYADILLYDAGDMPPKVPNPLAGAAMPEIIEVLPMEEAPEFVRRYTDTIKIARIMEALISMEVTYAPADAEPMEGGLALYLIYPDKTVDVRLQDSNYLCMKGDSSIYCVDDDNFEAFIDLIASTPNG
ncbi:MAG: hypothetical protein IJD38_11075 [Clostridia bacterium]|nr:hypothetical protein [Clostridia bacterium]